MSILHAAKQGPVTAVDLAATRKQMRDEGYAPRSATNGREWHCNTAGEASPWCGEERTTAIVPEARVAIPTLPIPVVEGEIGRAVEGATTITSSLSIRAVALEAAR